MIEVIKELYVFALILLVFSYLVPKEDYKAYIQFFIGIFLLVVILKPILNLMISNDSEGLYEVFEGFNEQMKTIENIRWEGKTEGDIYEFFDVKGEGE